MPTTPPTPRLVKGGLVILSDGAPRVVAFQYNPESLTRALQPQTSGGESQDGRAEPLRFKGPPVETLKFDAELDATDRLETGDPDAVEFGVLAQLAALEGLVYPASDQLRGTHGLAAAGTLEIAPVLAPVCLFVWSEKRVIPVRVTDLNVTEEMFGPNLVPLRAKVSLGLRVLSVADAGFDTPVGKRYMEYQRSKEKAAERAYGTAAAFNMINTPNFGG